MIDLNVNSFSQEIMFSEERVPLFMYWLVKLVFLNVERCFPDLL